MNKTVLLVALVLLTAFLAGCTQNTNTPPAGENNPPAGGTANQTPSGITQSDLTDLQTGSDQIDSGLQDLNPTP